MNCQCQGIEELFNQEHVDHELADYRAKGPAKTTRMLTQAIKSEGVAGSTLLDIGGGLGAIQHALMEAGVEQVTGIEASAAYLRAATAEAHRRGLDGRVSYRHGNFTDLAPEIDPADIVTLDRVICCYDDMENLVELSVKRARRLYGLVYPRDDWWIRAGRVLANLYFRLRRNPYRTFVHPTQGVEAIVNRGGFRRKFYRRTLIWQVVVYTR